MSHARWRQGSLLWSSPLFEHGWGLPSYLVLGPVVWEDCKFGSGLSSLLCEFSFSLSQKIRSNMGFPLHRKFQYCSVGFQWKLEQHWSLSESALCQCSGRNSEASVCLAGMEWNLGWSVQVLRVVSNQSESEGFMLLFPRETFLRKMVVTILCWFYCCWNCISVLTSSVTTLCWTSKIKAAFLDALKAVLCSHCVVLTESSSKVLLGQQSWTWWFFALMFFMFSGEVCVKAGAIGSRKYS